MDTIGYCDGGVDNCETSPIINISDIIRLRAGYSGAGKMIGVIKGTGAALMAVTGALFVSVNSWIGRRTGEEAS